MPAPADVGAALQNPIVQGWLRRLKLNVTVADVDLAPGCTKVYELVRVRRQIHDHERALGERVANYERDLVVLLGSTESIEGFLPRALKTVQFKNIGKAPRLEPGGVVSEFLDASRNARAKGWRDVWLYLAVTNPSSTRDHVRERWGRRGTQPVTEQRDFDGTVSKVTVFCPDGVEILPLRPPP